MTAHRRDQAGDVLRACGAAARRPRWRSASRYLTGGLCGPREGPHGTEYCVGYSEGLRRPGIIDLLGRGGESVPTSSDDDAAMLIRVVAGDDFAQSSLRWTE